MPTTEVANFSLENFVAILSELYLILSRLSLLLMNYQDSSASVMSLVIIVSSLFKLMGTMLVTQRALLLLFFILLQGHEGLGQKRSYTVLIWHSPPLPPRKISETNFQSNPLILMNVKMASFLLCSNVAFIYYIKKVSL